MCGIAGVCMIEGRELFSNTLPRMLETMAHRGPDGDGMWIDPRGSCGLGHKRLAIIDPEGGHQPLTNEDETVWVTFNGCIYNYQDIARLLRQKGHIFRTHSDTEVIVHAYEEWGTECVSRFNGMWAFALWDTKRQRLFCSRDRVGVKPFYYTWDGKAFAFASEIKALLAYDATTAHANLDGLRQYLTFQFCLEDTTLFHGIKKLLPGHNLVLTPGMAPVVSCYWDMQFDIDHQHDEAYFIDQLEWLLEDAVRLRLRSDVPLGAHLSGGLDSSTVVCLMRLLLGDAPIKTFTGAFREGEAFDESRYAKAVAQTVNTEYLETYLHADDFAQSIAKIIWHMDEPAAGPGVFPQYWVSKLASANVKVVLGGQGGDELFIGYARYLIAYLEECIKGAIEDSAHRGHYVATLETIIPSLPSLEQYTPMLKDFWREGLFGEQAQRYFRLMDRFTDSQPILQADFQAQLDPQQTFEEFRTIFNSHGATAMINRILCFDLKTHLQALLQVEDRTSMAWGLESRVPLLDYRLIEFITSVPPVIKFKNGRLKSLFLQAVQHLVPKEVLQRKDKMGFPVPLNQWFKHELRTFVADFLLSQRCRERGIFNPTAIEAALSRSQPFSRALWGALCVELWHRQFIDQVSM
ncbi:MAG: asparagine synthase (glutamine-hydrolyzing) [Candidatus Tectomicrobia bacterium]|uniref:asparagine synthase (glutamine-hydrolyzing) n=1 Tax=Tectimicrobiota bacterium TaxID=2528274 RepID=A0A937VY77_UNCTE|nr:asparagine synthase (glutamine-hydrolyzing) [Candidatus Tectomicrobia bacterium]